MWEQLKIKKKKISKPTFIGYSHFFIIIIIWIVMKPISSQGHLRLLNSKWNFYVLKLKIIDLDFWLIYSKLN